MNEIDLTIILRLTVGLLLVGHGAQKLFGWFGGHGLHGTAQWLAQTQPFGTAVLKAVTVAIVSQNHMTRKAGVCHGAVYAVVKSMAYVTAAKYCVET